MKWRYGLLAVVMIVGAVSGWWLQQKKGCVSVSPPPVVPPTVILLSIDTVRADHVGCYGYPRNTTPTIDRLAQESVRYRQVMSVAPNTAPAHMSMLTGMSPLVHGVHIYGKDGNYRTLAAEIPTLAELLHQHGYHTVGLTNSLQVGKVLGFARGFDRYEDDFFSVDGMYRDPVATEQNSRQRWREVLAEANQRRQPLFAFLHHFLNHSVYLAPPREYRERFADQLLDFLPRSHVELPNRPGVLDDDRRFFETVTGEDMRQRGHVAALYDGALAYSDHTVQIMIEELRAAGRWENTLFILVSDHGEELYEHKCWGHSQLWAEHLKVPLLVKFPAGHAAGRVIEQPVQTDALAPTILAVLGMPIPPTMQAAPLPPLRVTSPAPCFSYQPECDGQGEPQLTGMRVSTDSYTWLWHNRLPKKEFLFAATDTMEQHNLAAQQPAECRRLRAMTEEKMATDRALRARLLANTSAAEE